MKKFLLTLLLLAYGCEESSTDKQMLTPEGVAQSVGSPRDKRLVFFDVDEYGHKRPIINFIDTGDMTGMVQFAQTHTIYPNGNKDRNLPDLVPFKDTLVLFTPEKANLKALRIEVKDNKTGKSMSKNMEHPLFMPLSDYNNKSSKKDITYSKLSWSANIPADFVSPNMQITFIGTYTDNSEHTGVLNSTSIDFASPVEGYLFFIKLGMLTDYPSKKPFDFTMLDDPARALQEYLQTVPFSKYVAAAYEPRILSSVILRDGTIYELSGKRGPKESQYEKPEAHYGDMREDVAKAQISVGIDNANKGVASSALDQNHVYGNDIFYMTVHHTQGLYKGGKVQGHGLSGGNGIGTLYSSSGNEFSHEVGHAYGMGHYPHGAESDGSVHGFNTGWGYDAYKHRMRANVNWNPKPDSALPFYNTYRWNHDSMAGGWADSAISRYTHNTGWSTRDIQNKIGSKYVLGKKGTGYAYYKWDKDRREYVEVTSVIDQGFTERRTAPTKVGVPVITILGGYDPTDKTGTKAVLYPYFRGNYGNVFDNLFVKSQPESNCYLKIEYYNGQTEYVELSKERYKKNLINKFHVNIEESKKPKSVSLYVNGKLYKNGSTVNTTTIQQDVYSKPMKSAVILGKDKDTTYGYDVLNKMYVEKLNKEFELPYITGAPISPEQKNLVEILDRQGWITKLNSAAQEVANDYLKEYKSIKEVDLYLDSNYGALENRNAKAIAGLKTLLSTSGLGTVQELFAETKILGKCIEVYDNGENSKAVRVTDCTLENNQKWVQDSEGRIHSAAAPGYCLDSKNLGYLTECSVSPTQQWMAVAKDSKYQYKSRASNANKCIDYNEKKGTLTLWDCKSKPANQGFEAKIPLDENKYLSNMKGSLIDELYKYIRP